MAKHIYVVAAERSGDSLGAALIDSLRGKSPYIQISGIGGAQMNERGINSPIDVAPLAILGIFEGLVKYRTVMRLVRQATDTIFKSGADMVVLIDSWGFMIRVAERLKSQGYDGIIVKYVAPQVWAMREGRTKVLARSVDHLLTIHNFEAPYFTREGLDVTYVGNPVFDDDYSAGDGAALRKRLGIDGDDPVLCVLLGSRPAEIIRLAKPFGDTLALLKSKYPKLHVISPLAENTAQLTQEHTQKLGVFEDVIWLDERDKADAFAACDVALACSGTVTTQLAMAGVPTVVGYKLGTLSYLVASRLFKADYVSVVNLAANDELMPEFLQEACEAQTLSAPLLDLLQDKDFRQSRRDALLAVTQKMRAGQGSASDKAARALLNLFRKQS
ncbi:lipid-A-disaccharide synthase [Robiginitomaculum antarcticum]|uniref:lipid-A-disaccharide synthase n=1 Tax=Robiginitomaculum antarcticum TaxID=437507 RepID=UPI000373A5C4|nr:lipid-A-disaccharide synthase [Robiginitomaculum antarcticum]